MSRGIKKCLEDGVTSSVVVRYNVAGDLLIGRRFVGRFSVCQVSMYRWVVRCVRGWCVHCRDIFGGCVESICFMPKAAICWIIVALQIDARWRKMWQGEFDVEALLKGFSDLKHLLYRSVLRFEWGPRRWSGKRTPKRRHYGNCLVSGWRWNGVWGDSIGTRRR